MALRRDRSASGPSPRQLLPRGVPPQNTCEKGHAFKRLKQSAASLDAMILDIGLDDNRSGIEVLELMRLDAPIAGTQPDLPKARVAR